MVHYKVRDYALVRRQKRRSHHIASPKEETALTMNEKIEAMLEKVQKAPRYTGGEMNTTVKSWTRRPSTLPSASPIPMRSPCPTWA